MIFAKQDSWTSMISNPFRHPDKAGHCMAHVFITFVWVFLIKFILNVEVTFNVVLLAMVIDLWINTQIEIMDGTRPRADISWMLPMTFTNNEDYFNATVEGFSYKDWFAGIFGSLIVLFVWWLI